MMEDCRPMTPPMITNWKKVDASKDKDVNPTQYRQLIGSLMYLVNTRPDICYFVNTLSQFMVEPKRAHWAATKHVLRDLQGTVDYGLLNTRSKDIRLSGFTDADWEGSLVNRKSTSSSRNGNNNCKDVEEVAVWMQCWEKGPTSAQMQRELSYRCSSGNGRAMGSIAEDVGQAGLASAQRPMLDDQGDIQ
eukprot:PITA_04148